MGNESPDWESLAEEYFFDRIDNLPEENIIAIANGDSTEFKNITFNSLMESVRSKPEKNWGDLNTYSTVKNHMKMFDYVQKHAQEIVNKDLEFQFEQLEARRVSESIPILESGRKSPIRFEDYEIEEIVRLSQEGYSAEDIAAITNRTPSSIRNKIQRL